MRTWMREAVVTVVAGTALAGPAAALGLSLAPEPWRGPRVVWAILGACVALVAVLRRRRRRQP
jgi:hypothetical protein